MPHNHGNRDGTITETPDDNADTEENIQTGLANVQFGPDQRETTRFQVLLGHDLCRSMQTRRSQKGGRRRTPMRDMAFACVLQGVLHRVRPAGDLGCDLADAHAKGYLAKGLHPVMVCSFLESELR